MLVKELGKNVQATCRNASQVSIRVQPVPASQIGNNLSEIDRRPCLCNGGLSLDYQEYARRHKPKDGEVFHVNYNWFDAMNKVKHDLTKGSFGFRRARLLKNWTKALLLGLIQWDAQAKFGASSWQLRGQGRHGGRRSIRIVPLSDGRL